MIGSRPFAALKKLIRPRPPAEVCELCGAGLAAEHQHLTEPRTRKLSCVCQACALLFGSGRDGRFKLVPKDVRALTGFRLDDALWASLHVPINLVFVFHSSPTGQVVAVFPGPAGAIETPISLEAWQTIVADNPVLGDLRSDVEALLINRVGEARHHFRVPIDECYKLVGVMRTRWSGLSGGTEVWSEVERFFDRLRRQSDA